MTTLNAANYHVAWIAPLAIEYGAAIAMLDKIHDGTFPAARGGHYVFTAGEIGHHKVIIAKLAGEIGNVTTADLAAEIRLLFPNICLSFVVGIAAGLPLPPNRDIRLGDVLVAVPNQKDSGVVVYDFGKKTPEGFVPIKSFAQTSKLAQPAVKTVRGEWRRLQRDKFLSHYAKIMTKRHEVAVEGYPEDYTDPGQEKDEGPINPLVSVAGEDKADTDDATTTAATESIQDTRTNSEPPKNPLVYGMDQLERQIWC